MLKKTFIILLILSIISLTGIDSPVFNKWLKELSVAHAGRVHCFYNTYMCPITDALLDIGEGSGMGREYKNLYIDALAYIDGFGEDTDMGDFDIHSIDGLYGYDDNVGVDLGTDGYVKIFADTAIQFEMSTADTDVRLEFLGTTNSGLLEWMEDEDYFKFGDSIYVADGYKATADEVALKPAVTITVASSTSRGKDTADYVCDGTADDVQINAAIVALPANGGEVFILEGTYNLIAPAVIDSANITLSGTGPTTILNNTATAGEHCIQANNTTGSVWLDIVVKDLYIKGNASSGDGIYFKYVEEGIISQCFIDSNGDNGITLVSNVDTSQDCTEIQIIGNLIRSNGEDGISATHVHDIMIVGNNIEYNTQYGIYLDDILGVSVTANSLEHNGYGNIYVKDNADLAWSGVTIQGNTIEESNGNHSNIKLEGDNLQFNITGNKVLSGDWHNIYVLDGATGSIIGNTLTRADKSAVYITSTAGGASSDGVIVDSNYIYDNMEDLDGNRGVISLTGVSHCVISNNVIKNSNAGPAILLEDEAGTPRHATYNIITGNRCYDDQGTKTQTYGIQSTGSSATNTITGNDFTGNLTGHWSLAGTDNIFNYDGTGFLSSLNVAIGTGADTSKAALHVKRTTFPVAYLERETSGGAYTYGAVRLVNSVSAGNTAQDNMGIAFYFGLENDNGDIEHAGMVGSRFSDVTDGSENMELVFGVADGGIDPYNYIRGTWDINDFTLINTNFKLNDAKSLYLRSSDEAEWLSITQGDNDVVFAGGGTNDRHFLLNPNNNIGINTASPTARLHLPAGTASAGTGPLKFTSGTLLTAPEAGTIEYDGDKFYITNNGKQKALDRTSDVAVATVTVVNTVVETIMWTGDMAANSLDAGNLLMFHADGIVSNNSANAGDEVTIRIKVGGVTKVTLNPNLKQLTNVDWHVDANATQRTVGAAGTRAMHVHLVIGDPITTGDDIWVIGVANIDTTANMDVTITAQWASAHANNTISLYQGFMRYKN